MTQVLLLISIVAVLTWVFLHKRSSKIISLPAGSEELLTEHVAFFRLLDDAGKIRFTEKIKEFLAYVQIHGVNTTVEDLDILLIASSAIIPVFGFPEWKYYNLRDVLLYPDTFNGVEFLTAGNNRDVLGMVGDGPMQRMMILSKTALREGFKNSSGKENTGIHEFIHLLDKADGSVDGLPEALLQRQYSIPWLHLMAQNIAAIKQGKSDINIYGAKNEAEFFAVASEYFFEQPELFKKEHADLYDLMTKIFHQTPPQK